MGRVKLRTGRGDVYHAAIDEDYELGGYWRTNGRGDREWVQVRQVRLPFEGPPIPDRLRWSKRQGVLF